MNYNELYIEHHGVLGQKWGVRRYQNADGSLTAAGKKHVSPIVSRTDNRPEFMKKASDRGINAAANRQYQKQRDKMLEKTTSNNNHKDYDNSSRNKKIAVGVTTGVVAAGATAVAALYVAKHPQAVAKVFNAAKNVNLKDVRKETIAKGKAYMKTASKQMAEGVKEGVKEGLHDGPKTLGKALVKGSVMYGGYKVFENAVGKKVADRVFSANDPKKIGKFYKSSPEADNSTSDDEKD